MFDAFPTIVTHLEKQFSVIKEIPGFLSGSEIIFLLLKETYSLYETVHAHLKKRITIEWYESSKSWNSKIRVISIELYPTIR